MGMIMHDDVPYGEGTSYTQGTGIAINNNVIAVDADNTPTAGSEKPVKSKGVFSALEANKEESASLLKSTVGWTGKNLLNDDSYYYEANVSVNKTNHTFTVSASTLATQYSSIMFRPSSNILFPAGNYTLTVDVDTIGDTTARIAARRSNNSIITAKILAVGANELKINVTEDFYISVFPRFEKSDAATITFSNIMLRKADITDDTYEPYHESMETMYEEEIHGVNLLKNKIVSQTINGITWTLNANGTITANGTAESQHSQIPITFTFNKSFDAIFSGCPAGGGTYASPKYDIYIWDNVANERAKKWDGTTPVDSDYGNTDQEVKIVAGRSYFMTLRVFTGQTVSNLVFKPMLRKAEIEDSTYRPYNEQAIQNQLNAQGVLGAKNLLKYPYADAAITQNGITYTYSSKNEVIANGTATARSWRTLMNDFTSLKLNERYILSGCPSGGGVHSYSIWLTYNDGTETSVRDYGNGIEFINTGNLIRIQVVVENGYTANNLTFKPMIRLASDPDDTYVPYAMTNRELTEKVSVELLNIGLTASDKATKLRDDSRRFGNVVNIRIQIQVTDEIANNTEIFRLDGLPHTGYGIAILGETNTGEIIPLMIPSSGSNFVASCRKTIPTGYYAISYTYIE